MVKLEKKYLLKLTITDTEGFLAITLRNSIFSGNLTISADEDFFKNNYGMINLSGEIDKKDNDGMTAIAFNECIFVSDGRIEFAKDNESGAFTAGARIDNSNISDIKIRIMNRGFASIFLFKLIELTGDAILS